MAEKGNNNKLHAIILWIVGIIALIAGIAIATIHNVLRGSGLGTLLIVTGIVLLIIGLLRYMYKPKNNLSTAPPPPPPS